jgi:hypothetical protein
MDSRGMPCARARGAWGVPFEGTQAIVSLQLLTCLRRFHVVGMDPHWFGWGGRIRTSASLWTCWTTQGRCPHAHSDNNKPEV